MKLIVTVKKLNKRSSIPVTLAEKNIIGIVLQGFRFEGEEISDVPNSKLGKWYKDRDGYFYWGGGIMIDPMRAINSVVGLPLNLPPNYRLGFDISHHNNFINWADIKESGASFVFIKISEGVGTPDNKAKEHANNAKQIGLKVGYYHFCRPDKRNGGSVIDDATSEAVDALKRIEGLQKSDLPLVLDLEDQATWDTPLTSEEYKLWIITFINKIKDKSGNDCIIYSRKGYLNSKLPYGHNLGKYKIWVSFYPSKPDFYKVECPSGWEDWAIWQFTENGVIGRNSKLDLNILKDGILF